LLELWLVQNIELQVHSVQEYIFINKLHCKQPEKVPNKIICTQNE